MALHVDGCRQHCACGPNGEVAWLGLGLGLGSRHRVRVRVGLGLGLELGCWSRQLGELTCAILDGHCDAIAGNEAPRLTPWSAVERVVQGARTLPKAHLSKAVCTRVVLHVDEPAAWIVVAGIELHQIWIKLHQIGVSARLVIVAMLVRMVLMIMLVVVYAHHLDRAGLPERSLVVSGVAQHAVARAEAPLAHTLALIIVAMLVHIVIVYAHHLDRAGLCGPSNQRLRLLRAVVGRGAAPLRRARNVLDVYSQKKIASSLSAPIRREPFASPSSYPWLRPFLSPNISKQLADRAALAIFDVECAGAGGGADAARGREQGGLLWREPRQARPAKALRGAVESRWQSGVPGPLRHRRGGGAVHRANAGGAGDGAEACSGAVADERGGAAAGAGGGADAARGREQDGLLRRVPQPPRQAQALCGAGEAQ
eukprot:scaffold6115_cov57-Phaeocystis_antarctica.AAC.5